MFPAGNPISHVIPNWMRSFGQECSSPLPVFVSTLDRVSELAVQPGARSSLDVRCFSAPLAPMLQSEKLGEQCRAPRPTGRGLSTSHTPQRMRFGTVPVSISTSPRFIDGGYVSPIAELTLCISITNGNDTNSPLRHFGHVSERFIPVSPGSAVFSEPT